MRMPFLCSVTILLDQNPKCKKAQYFDKGQMCDKTAL